MSKGIYRFYFPPQLGHLLDPCDNAFHASIHKRYWEIIDKKEHVTLLEQIFAIHRAYFSEKEKSVRKYFEKCGIIGDLSPREVLAKLFYEGVYPSAKFRLLHKKQLMAFLAWKKKGTIEEVFGGMFEHLFEQRQ